MDSKRRLFLLLLFGLISFHPIFPAAQTNRLSSPSPDWTPLPTSGAPVPRQGFAYAWAEELGELFIWGGVYDDSPASGMRYHLADDIWLPLPPAPAGLGLGYPSVVWTGSELLVWGAYDEDLNTGARYDPAAGTWTPISSLNAPSPRMYQTAVWTGSEMIVWGGRGLDAEPLSDGSRYNPATDTWSPVSDSNAPAARELHTAVWTGAEMIVWGGGRLVNTNLQNTGGRYDPATNTWAPVQTSNAPLARTSHSAVWTGSKMIIWGGLAGMGQSLVDGSAYDPATNTWSAIPAPSLEPRHLHSAIWAKDASASGEMIVWGGKYSSISGVIALKNGARYDPVANTWAPLPEPPAGFPGRSEHAAVWTGSASNEMLVWGGSSGWGNYNSGARYNLSENAWTLMAAETIPAPRTSHTAVWTGSDNIFAGKMIVWGGLGSDFEPLNTGESFSLLTNNWSPITDVGAPSPRSSHTAVWTGSSPANGLMLVWGGLDASDQPLNSGGRYNPAAGGWSGITLSNAPSARRGHTAVWTGSEMIIWGGNGGSTQNLALKTGARYNPTTDQWMAVSTTNAPDARYDHTAVWTGTEMIVWGGFNSSAGSLNSGGRYNPATNTWAALPLPAAFKSRVGHAAAWAPAPTPAGSLIIWGGWNLDSQGGGPRLNDGARLDLASETWLPISVGGAPTFCDQSFTWNGAEMVVWGGGNCDATGSGGAYNPTTGAWRRLPSSDAVLERYSASIVWAGSAESGTVIVWGGHVYYPTNTGAHMFPQGLTSSLYLPIISPR